MKVTYVKIAAEATAVLLRATVECVLLFVSVVSVGPPWGGYAYDYFAEDYTVTT